MSIVVTGSIATDHLMSFPGKFSDSLVVDQLDKISLSFLVDDLEIRRGGCAANIAFGLASLGHRPLLVGAVGEDFRDYRAWLERHGVDCSPIYVSETKHTARFVCTTDQTMAQIATFYSGAMAEAGRIELGPIAAEHGTPDIVVIGPNDPAAMQQYTDDCRTRGFAFAADPSQQLALAGGDAIRGLIDGATYLFSNEYEAALIEQKTGWGRDEVLKRVGTRVVTLGRDGVRVEREGDEDVVVPAISGVNAVEPTGVGDSFRAGYLAAVQAGLGTERACQVGCAIAASVVETTGTQEYSLSSAGFIGRIEATYGPDAADEIAAALNLPAS